MYDIGGFLKDMRFCVAVHMDLSEKYAQEAGVPQGSILSISLFAIKINSLVNVILPGIYSSLFVEDVQIAYSDYNSKRFLKIYNPQ